MPFGQDRFARDNLSCYKHESRVCRWLARHSRNGSRGHPQSGRRVHPMFGAFASTAEGTGCNFACAPPDSKSCRSGIQVEAQAVPCGRMAFNPLHRADIPKAPSRRGAAEAGSGRFEQRRSEHGDVDGGLGSGADRRQRLRGPTSAMPGRGGLLLAVRTRQRQSQGGVLRALPGSGRSVFAMRAAEDPMRSATGE